MQSLLSFSNPGKNVFSHDEIDVAGTFLKMDCHGNVILRPSWKLKRMANFG
jgi:hypothetical protein